MTGTTAPLSRPSPLSRLFGLGSVFGKTLRDSRRATLIIGFAIGALLAVVAAGIISQFDTAEARDEIGNIVNAVPPIMQGLAGKPVNVETLGGYIQYKYGGFLPLVTGLWSILALSATLAGESRRGSMDILVAAPLSRRRIAWQKVLGHILMVGVAMAIVGTSIAVAGNTMAVLPGDAISAQAAFGFAIWLFLMSLAAGSLAFALAPFVGRGSAAGLAGAAMLGGFLLAGYQTAIPELAPFANLTWFGWTADHIPLANQFDWPSLGLVAAFVILMVVIGVEAFTRRDLGATTAIPGPRLPAGLLGLSGPTARATSERFATGLSWGVGLGVFGMLIAGSGAAFIEQIGESPEFERVLGIIFPGIDVGTVGGFLQLVFIEFGLVMAGLAAAGLVGGWASDERSGMLELLLPTPIRRSWWPLSGAIGVGVAIVVLVVVAAVGIAIGTLLAGGELATPVVGTLAIGLYAAAMAGIGIAIGGLINPRIAAPAVLAITLITWLTDLVGGDLGIPDAIHQLALSTHMGQPMVGIWDPVGIVACLVLAVAGVAIGTWGFTRRDLKG